MATEGSQFLVDAATYLGAAAVAVPVFNRLKLGSILGYLTAGVILGPSVLDAMHQEEGVFHIAELGVVLFLFVIGLELSLSRLWALRRYIFGLGASQLLITGAIITLIFVYVDDMPIAGATIAGLSLAFSSTAFALQYMKDRGDLNSPYGAKAFPVLLFQDLAVVPLLAAIPIIAGAQTGEGPSASGVDPWIGIAKAVGVIALLTVIGRFALNPVLRMVARSGSREAFAATALFIVAAVSLAVSWAGLSMALGAFLAGVLLAESAYRHQIETDIEPFRGLLLGLFFISIGMKLNLTDILNSWWIVLGGAVGLVGLKALILTFLTQRFGATWPDAIKTGAVLSQGGEFAFVVFTLGASSGLFTDGEATLLSAIVTISMVMTPFAMILARQTTPKTAMSEDGLEGPRLNEGHIIVAGFGRMGQIISQVVQNAGVDVTAIDRNPDHIRNAERYGFKVYFGDASRLDLLKTAGAAEARAIILCMDDPEAVNHAVVAIKQSLPSVSVHAIAHDRMHEIQLRRLGPDVIVRETLESSILIARKALEQMNFSDDMIEDFIEQFRERDRERLLQQMDYGPEAGMEIMHQRYVKRDA
ncbi:MAG: monovalent cation:proton antiporter-2 (CPA2) family protein [Pseudomonadota bacterium]